MAQIFFIALPLSLAWMVLAGQANIPGFFVGYVISFGVLLVIRFNTSYQAEDEPINLARVPMQIVTLIFYILRLTWDVMVSGASVAWVVIQPTMPIKPVVRRITTQDDRNSGLAAALSAHSITITPGELVVDFEEEDGEVYMLIHSLNKDQSTEERLIEEQKNRLSLIKRVLGRD